MIQYLQREPQGNTEPEKLIANELNIDQFQAKLLCMRGFDDPVSARQFLKPCLDDLHDPFLFEQMSDAVDCIYAAIDVEEKICVYGDYDVDGIMAVTILSRHLSSMGADVFSYIPKRHGEGYGLNNEAIDKVIASGASLMITVDCGITALAEIEYAYSMGLAMIITDHHQCLEVLPECEAVINPVCSSTYPFKKLCGAGVALKVVQALSGIEAIEPYLQYATLATIADIVDLNGENRAIAYAGLQNMNDVGCVLGIRELAAAAGHVNRRVDETTIGFALAPRINAAGRTGSPERALNLFMTDDEAQAKKLAQELDEENKRRQEIEAGIIATAFEKIKTEVDIVSDNAIVLECEGWNPGVIGIVASRLVERFSKPVILLAKEGTQSVGSGRSIRGIHLFNALSAMSDLFIRFGGHEMAAGLTIECGKVEEFKQRLQEYLQQNVEKVAYIPKVYYDICLKPSDFTLDFANNLSALAPFGIGNPSPVFRVNGRVENARLRGGDKTHLSFVLDNAVECIAFSQGRRFNELSGERVDMLCTAKINNFKEDKVQCEVKHIRIADAATDSFLQCNEWLFYEACLNWHGKSEIKASIQKGDLEELKSQIMVNPQGTLIACYTPLGAKKLIEWIAKNKLYSMVDFAIGNICDARGYNTVLFAPLPDNSALKIYKNIYVFDFCPSGKALQALMDINGKVEYLNADINVDEFFNNLAVSREQLIPVYKAMLVIAGFKTIFASFEDYYAKITSRIKVDKYQLAFAVKVFVELEFFTVDTRAGYKIEAAKNVKKVDLLSSNIFMYANNAKGEYIY